jgi:ketosteroid isomerase-like protein
VSADGDGGVVGRYLRAMIAHQWDAMAACLADDVVRTGPYGDTYASRPEYVAFLSDLMPKLPGYSMDVAQIVYTADGRTAVAELSETVEVAGTPKLTPEALVFDLTTDGLIGRIRIYIQELGVPARNLP